MVRRLWRPAVHEAGHTVVGLHLGLKPRNVSIIADESDGSLGHTDHSGFARVEDYIFDPETGRPKRTYRLWDPELDDPARLERRIVIQFAGVVAERQIVGGRYNWGGAEDDMAWANEFLFHFAESNETRARHKRALWARTDALVQRYRAEIEDFAEALISRPTMTRKEVADVLRALSDERLRRASSETGPT
jgi:hypothetical protein